jgi:hypothetical protein
MSDWLDVHMAFWRYPVVVVVFVTAGITHWSLGLWALYERRQFRYRLPEWTQLMLGLSIPFLLVSHFVGARLQAPLFGRDVYYAQVFANWINRPHLEWVQFTLLLVAWVHGCIGLYYWLRLKRFFTRAAPYLLVAATLLPTLALLGIIQGGREVPMLWSSIPFEVRVTVENPSSIGVPFAVLEDRRAVASEYVSGSTQLFTELPAGEPVEIVYRLKTPSPGVLRFEGVKVRVADFHGFFYRHFQHVGDGFDGRVVRQGAAHVRDCSLVVTESLFREPNRTQKVRVGGRPRQSCFECFDCGRVIVPNQGLVKACREVSLRKLRCQFQCFLRPPSRGFGVRRGPCAHPSRCIDLGDASPGLRER